MNTGERTLARTAPTASQKVVVVDGSADVMDLLESVLEGGRYDLLFADASQHAYSLVAREQPNLVVLCMTLDSTDGFQLLSMLKLDPQTRAIPVVTYTTDVEEDGEDAQEIVEDAEELPAAQPRRLTLN
jgi:CheY-like chemotaxis protein